MKQFLGVITIAATSALFVTSCNNGKPAEGAATTADTAKKETVIPISLKPVGQSPEFANAKLAVKSTEFSEVGKDSTNVIFSYDVKGYELKAQTADSATKGCANSHQGQHIHFILDNGPYKALYEPKNGFTVANGEHYVLSFLSRSYHESVKSKGAAVLSHFSVTGKDEKHREFKKLDIPASPMLFYSRPKGDYVGKETENVLLDFYVWNCELSDTGYKVKADITNETKTTSTSLTIAKWEPNFIQNLGIGKCKVVLTLVDKTGAPVQGPNTTVTREFNLKAEETAK